MTDAMTIKELEAENARLKEQLAELRTAADRLTRAAGLARTYVEDSKDRSTIAVAIDAAVAAIANAKRAATSPASPPDERADTVVRIFSIYTTAGEMTTDIVDMLNWDWHQQPTPPHSTGFDIVLSVRRIKQQEASNG